jgi:hypothetical protein
MEEYIESDERNERRNKQEYLIKNIIEAQYDPEAFSDFLSKEKENGQDIDNWNIEELETMVALFRRLFPNSNTAEQLQRKLEGLELSDDEKVLYANRISTTKKKRTILFSNKFSIVISNIEVIDGGIFFGKSLCFHIDIPQIDLMVRRTEPEFRWLYDSLAREYPFVPLPPLLRLSDKFTEPGVIAQYKKYYEKFLNECARHPELKNALALEIFLVCQSKEEMTMKTKEISKYYKNNVLIDRYLSKKAFDSLEKNPIEAFPTVAGSTDIKLSFVLKKHFVTIDGQYPQYTQLYERIERLSDEYQKHYSKLIDVNKQLREALVELQNTAIKFNSQKELKLKSNLIEDAVYGSIANYFENFGGVTRKNPGGKPNSHRHEHRRVLPLSQGIPRQCPGIPGAAKFRQQRVHSSQVIPQRQESQATHARQPTLGHRARGLQGLGLDAGGGQGRHRNCPQAIFPRGIFTRRH